MRNILVTLPDGALDFKDLDLWLFTIPVSSINYDYGPEGIFDSELAAMADAAVATAIPTTDLETITEEYLMIFGETITYYPNGSTGREILAIIDRERPAGIEDAPYGSAPMTVIVVANNAEDGIASSEIDLGKDTVSLPVRIGEVAQERPIKRILSQDAGMLELEVR